MSVLPQTRPTDPGDVEHGHSGKELNIGDAMNRRYIQVCNLDHHGRSVQRLWGLHFPKGIHTYLESAD